MSKFINIYECSPNLLLIREVSALSDAVDRIAAIPGMIAVILFGSAAKREVDEGSDVDFFVLFEDEASMREREWDVTLSVPRGVFVHTICASLDSLHKLNPVFVRSVFEGGVVLFLKHPLRVKAELLLLSPCLLVSYSLRGLDRRKKQRVAYALFGKGERSGLVGTLNGFRVGRGAFVVPEEEAGAILEFLRREGVDFEVRRVFAEAGSSFMGAGHGP